MNRSILNDDKASEKYGAEIWGKYITLGKYGASPRSESTRGKQERRRASPRLESKFKHSGANREKMPDQGRKNREGIPLDRRDDF